jgi:peroxiredoxin
LEKYKDKFLEKGIEVAAIGMGDPKSVLKFSQKYNISFPIYIDMSRSSYELFEFPVQLGIGLSTIFKAKKHFDKGFRQGSPQGSVLQQGGEILFDDGEIHFKNIAQRAGEHGDLEEILLEL